MATVNFYLDKADKQGKCFILMTYLANGQKFRHSVKFKILPNSWISRKQRLKERSREDQLINSVQSDRYDIILKQIGDNVRSIRNAQGLTIQQVANEAEIEYRQLGRIEREEVMPQLLL